MFNVNAASGALAVGAIGVFLKHNESTAKPIKVKVMGEPDATTGLIPVKQWAVANVAAEAPSTSASVTSQSGRKNK